MAPTAVQTKNVLIHAMELLHRALIQSRQRHLALVDSPFLRRPLLISLLVRHCSYDPSMLTTKVDGPGWLYVFYFILNETTRTQLADLDTAPAAVRVLSKFINTDSVAFRERLKVY